MKTYCKILGVVCVLLIAGCSSSEDNSEVVEKPSVVGVWSIVNGLDFSYLTLLSNNTFIYAENDLTVLSDEENGLEVGTYIYDADADNIKFNIAYDDNAPGEDSGVGDVGTQVSLSATIINNKLSLAGELIFDSEDIEVSISPVVGVWSVVNGAGFSHLILLNDNTFIYAENDLTVLSNKENGVEVGTYSYDVSTRKITFNVVYDDNDPGNDSGVGDSGTPVINLITLSNNDNTLSMAGFEFIKAL